MAKQMRDMADSTRELERSRIDIQQRLFNEQLQYQKDRDRRLQDNAKQANDNAKLAIEKQSDVVLYLSQLAAAFTSGCMDHGRDSPVLPQEAVGRSGHAPPATAAVPGTSDASDAAGPVVHPQEHNDV